jgi:hypothetical protein
MVGALELTGAGLAGAVLAALLAGVGIGRAAWSLLSARSATRVRRLAEALADTAHEVSDRSAFEQRESRSLEQG